MSIKISELPNATSIGDNDLIPIVQDGTTKNIEYENFKQEVETTIDSSSTNDNPVGAKAVYDYSAPIEHSSTQTTYGQGTSTKYGHCKTIDNLTTSTYVAGESLSAHQGYVLDQGKQNLIDDNSKLSADLVTDEDTTNKFVTSTDITNWNAKPTNAQLHKTYSPLLEGQATGSFINLTNAYDTPPTQFELLGNATQADTPTPDYPQDIHVVTGDNTVKVVGKNLWNYTFEVAEYNDQGQKASTTVWLVNTTIIPVKPSTTYTVSQKEHPCQYRIVYFNNNTFISRESNTINTTSGYTNFSFTTPANCNGLYIQFRTTTERAAQGSTSVNTGDVTNVQLEQNSSATTYEPYHAETLTIPLGNIELAKIGDYTDKLFKAIEGDSVYDSLDSTTKGILTSGSWYKQGNIGKQVFNGSEAGWGQGNTSNGKRNYIAIDNLRIQNNGGYAISNYFERISANSSWTNDINGVAVNSNTEQLLIKTISTMELDTLEKFKTWLSTHNTTVYYILATPTYTEITDNTLITALEEIYTLNLNKPISNIWTEPSGTNANAGIWLSYQKDLATVISDLTNAIISLGGNI